jgi:hypothetical protein
MMNKSEQSREAWILAALAGVGTWLSAAEIARETQIPSDETNATLQRLYNTGRVIRTLATREVIAEAREERKRLRALTLDVQVFAIPREETEKYHARRFALDLAENKAKRAAKAED